ncbi:Zinc finger, double-stranded RNA binding protein [Fusarium austroafricanum]|uniref:Zinc finger, double-stranded RNA binding protein n=1 Tax=Fusarium austroafricanum TaxID=2364996 RepID=A0A8H4KTE5_9HYPO|nr:Zinc finger, double-stranded RNA binding protein [Fusarium austroafricanum]
MMTPMADLLEVLGAPERICRRWNAAIYSPALVHLSAHANSAQPPTQPPTSSLRNGRGTTVDTPGILGERVGPTSIPLRRSPRIAEKQAAQAANVANVPAEPRGDGRVLNLGDCCSWRDRIRKRQRADHYSQDNHPVKRRKSTTERLVPCENSTGETALNALPQRPQVQTSPLQMLLDLQGTVAQISAIFEVTLSLVALQANTSAPFSDDTISIPRSKNPLPLSHHIHLWSVLARVPRRAVSRQQHMNGVAHWAETSEPEEPENEFDDCDDAFITWMTYATTRSRSTSTAIPAIPTVLPRLEQHQTGTYVPRPHDSSRPESYVRLH